jgi:hypothetical protein
MGKWDQYTENTPSSNKWEQYAETPQSSEIPAVSPAQSILSRGMGDAAILGGLGTAYMAGKWGLPKLANIAQSIPAVYSDTIASDYAKGVRKSFVQAHTDEINKFGAKLDNLMAKNPEGTVNLKNLVDDIKSNWQDMPNEARTYLNKTPHLRDMIKNAETPTELSLRQSQDVINYLNKGAKNFDIREVINNIKGEQLNNFEEMAGVRSDYAKFIEPYNNVKKYFKYNNLLKNIENKFGGAEGITDVKSILPKSVVDKMGGYRWAKSIFTPSRWLPKLTGLGRGLMAGMGENVLTNKVLENAYGTSDPRLLMSPLTGDKQAQEEAFRLWAAQNVT